MKKLLTSLIVLLLLSGCDKTVGQPKKEENNEPEPMEVEEEIEISSEEGEESGGF